MSVSASEVAQILRDRLRINGGDVITMPWSEFYGINKIERFREERGDEIWRILQQEHGMIFCQGQRVIAVMFDTNFHPG